MQKFYCLKSRDPSFRYRRYQAPGIRYKYPDGGWILLPEVDDYTLEEITPPCPMPHELNYGRQNISIDSKGNCTPTTVYMFPPKTGWEGHTNAPFRDLLIVNSAFNYTRLFPDPYAIKGFSTIWCSRWTSAYQVYVTDNTGTQRLILNASGFGLVIASFQVRPEYQKDCPPAKCKFTAFKKGAIVYEETRDICPEVERIVCNLQENYHTLLIKKEPDTEVVEVCDFTRDNDGSGNESRYPLPHNELNVYVLKNIQNSQGEYTDYRFVAKLASHEDCPPPIYEPLCTKKCPNNTCPVRCLSHVCCYNDKGVSIDKILLSEYNG